MAAHGQSGALLARDHDGGVPSDPAAELAFEGLVAGVEGLLFDGNCVDVGGRQVRRGLDALAPGVFLHGHEDVAGALGPARLDEVVDRLEPFAGFLGVDVGYVVRLAVDQR